MQANRPKSPLIGGRTRRHAPPKVAAREPHAPPIPTISDGHQILPQPTSTSQQQLSQLQLRPIQSGKSRIYLESFGTLGFQIQNSSNP